MSYFQPRSVRGDSSSEDEGGGVGGEGGGVLAELPVAGLRQKQWQKRRDTGKGRGKGKTVRGKTGGKKR